MVARCWEAANALPSMYGGSGMGAQRAAWEAAFIAELSALRRLDHLQILLDLVKAFETVPHHLLVRAAIEKGYPLALLRLSLAAYRLARSISIDGIFSKTLLATRGITAGSGFATSELKLLLHDMMTQLHVRWPTLNAQLYVDDLSLSASGETEYLLHLLDKVLSFVVHILQDVLRMEVSTKKSVVISGKPSLAYRFTKLATSKVTKAARWAKLLGTDAAGGRRRSTKAFKNRIKQVARRVKRFHDLRRVGVNVKQMTRAAATPAISYGMDIMGLSDSALLDARRLTLRAAAPPNAGKNVDAALAALDGKDGTMDVAFDAHLLGLRHFAHAHWEGWFDSKTLTEAFQFGATRVAKAVGSPWHSVHGPITALVATLQRLGWCMPSAFEAIDDLGCSWSFVRDPPAVIVDAGKRSVRRWRYLRIIKDIPGLIPDDIDAGQLSEAGRTLLLDFSDVTSAPCKQKGPSKQVPFWSAAFRSCTLSALSGGQWTQTRRASVPAWGIDDNRCQLCFTAAGTAAHRFECPATCPEKGWPRPPEAAELCRRQIGFDRCRILDLRGLLTIKLPMPEQHEASLDWFLWPDSLPDDVTWYIDGSMLFREVYELRAVGFGLVAHSKSLGLVAYSGGNPPWWCRTAAAAEAWALYTVLALSVLSPVVKTDCLALLNAARTGLQAATMASKRIARIWGMIGTVLDGDLSSLADDSRLVWMPAHQGFGAVGQRVLSSGKTYTVVDWRANRLADAIAKAFANDMAPPGSMVSLTMCARAAYRHSVALLGCVTHAANNHRVQVTRDDGTTTYVTKRDVMEHTSNKAATSRRKARQGAEHDSEQQASGQASDVDPANMLMEGQRTGVAGIPGCLDLTPSRAQAPPQDAAGVYAKRRCLQNQARSQHNERARLFDEQCLRARVNDIGAACGSPQTSATSRLLALAERVGSKASQV